MSKKPGSAAKEKKPAMADLSVSGVRISSATNNGRTKSAGTSSDGSSAGPVPKIQVLEAQDLLGTAMELDEQVGEEEGEVFAISTSDADLWFDSVIGHIEDIIMDDDFQNLQQAFFNKHCQEFDNSDENKLVYTDIHHSYVETIERFLEMKLRQRLDSFNMADFIREVEQRWHACENSSMSEDEKFVLGLDGEVFEILQSFGDFLCFKDMMLDHKKSKQGNCPDFSSGLRVLNMNTPR